jgi:hypothetical protein
VPENCPGGQDTIPMDRDKLAQFLQVPAKDKIVSVAGFVQAGITELVNGR